MACTTRALKIANKKFFLKKICVLLATLAWIGPASATSADEWPQVRVPRQIETFDVAQEGAVNGTRARIRGFVSRATPSELAASFRQLLGQPLMEDRRGDKLILGRGEGRYYVTVQLDPLGSGTRGVIAVTRPPVDKEEPADVNAARRLLSALPPGSTLTSHTSSLDGGTRADHDAIVNAHSIGINREYVQRMLRADGFILERESGASPAMRVRSHIAPDARTLFFKRPGAEAIAVLFSNDSGKSVIVLNRVRFAAPSR
jgi:hypothetical protein